MRVAEALSPQSLGADVMARGSPLSHLHALRWRQAGVVFELASSEQDVISRSLSVFARLGEKTADEADHRWIVEKQSPTGTSGAESWILSVTPRGGEAARISRHASVDQVFLEIEADTLQRLLARQRGSVGVHAALLSKEGRGVVIVGPSYAGKSTLATALWCRGWSFLCDDLVFLNSAALRASPAPRRVSLRETSRELVGEEVWKAVQRTPSCFRTSDGFLFHPHEVRGELPPSDTSLNAIVFLERRGIKVEPAEGRAINPARAAVALFPYAFNLRDEPFIDGMRVIAPITAAVPSYDLGRGDLDRMVSIVEEAIGD